jgi:hypothetical protein
MTSKFVVGQAVNFNKKYPWMSGGPYEVVSVLPPGQDDSTTYRVKSQVEPFARAANEADLTAVGLAPVRQTAPVRWADLLSQRSRPTRSR